MSGLLSDIDDPRTQGLLGTFLSMLAASGPSTQRRTFGQIAGASGLEGMKQYDQAKVIKQRDEELRRRNELLNMQIEKVKRADTDDQNWRNFLKGYRPPGPVQPEQIDLLRNAPRELQDEIIKGMIGAGKNGLPSDWQTAMLYMNGTPEQRAAFEATKRGLQMVAGVPHVRDAEGKLVPLLPPERVAGIAETIAGAKERGTQAMRGQYETVEPYNPDTGGKEIKFRSQLPGFPSPVQSGAERQRLQRGIAAQEGATDSSYFAGPSGAPLDLTWNGARLPNFGQAPKPAQAGPTAEQKARQDAEAERLRKIADARAKAQTDLPRVMANGNEMVSTLEKAISHPGLDKYVGAASVIPDSLVIPATEQAAFQGIFQKIQGKSFLQAYETLKGGGQITEIEGEKATAAISALQNRKLGPKAWKEEAKTLVDIVKLGMARQAAMARGVPFITSDDEFDALPSGSTFIDPKGKERRKP